MTLKSFAGMVREILAGRLPGSEVRVVETTKNNGIRLTGIMVRQEGSRLGPVFYMEGYYALCKAGMPVGKIADSILGEYRPYDAPGCFPEKIWTDFQMAKRGLYCRLVNLERNREMLGHVPHVPFHDMAATFYLALYEDGEKEATVGVTDRMMENWGLESVGELYATALSNTEGRYPASITPLPEVLEKAAGLAMDGPCMEMYAATNRSATGGAAVVLYEGLLDRFAGKAGGDFYMFPSSIHDWIFAPASESADTGGIRQLSGLVNETDMLGTEILSDTVYYYDSRAREIKKL